MPQYSTRVKFCQPIYKIEPTVQHGRRWTLIEISYEASLHLSTGLCWRSAIRRVAAVSWRQWIGVTDKSPLPGELAAKKNVRWKTSIPSEKSSPVITADRNFLTGHENGKLVTLGLDRNTGKVLWVREAPGHRGEKRHQSNDPASPTPASDGKTVYVFFAGLCSPPTMRTVRRDGRFL
jgi:hypothetical protein